jgi:hypothetical protein
MASRGRRVSLLDQRRVGIAILIVFGRRRIGTVVVRIIGPELPRVAIVIISGPTPNRINPGRPPIPIAEPGPAESPAKSPAGPPTESETPSEAAVPATSAFAESETTPRHERCAQSRRIPESPITMQITANVGRWARSTGITNHRSRFPNLATLSGETPGGVSSGRGPSTAKGLPTRACRISSLWCGRHGTASSPEAAKGMPLSIWHRVTQR